MHRSYLYAPGHSAKLLGKVFDCGADAVILDLEDAVPPERKAEARKLVAEVLGRRPAYVRINAVRTEQAERDLEAIGGLCADIKVPKVESAEDLAWVAARAPDARLHPILESARGVLAAREIAAAPGVAGLSMGIQDLSRDLRSGTGWESMLLARSQVVMASSAAGAVPPVDSAFAAIRDLDALRREAVAARELGFFGKVAVHPGQVDVINEVFTPSESQLAHAREIVRAFDAAGQAATRTPAGDFVDAPVAERARNLLRLGRATPA
ncbi:HpcH/HpaI aldolase/citrate lyase family protein [Acrocarpospora macrocephala]|uniref:HpcH/HpaI aldolase/citrate lyase family protein n=1 Tax=Acrocarpospora macrocephala TaxID=150177 RepID=UPI0012D3009B|nr:CoA ester lyase [Acrocarpospora macrocephala]